MSDFGEVLFSSGGGGGGCAIGMFHTEGYGFQAVHSGIGYKESLGSRKLINWLKILLYILGKPGIITHNQNRKQGVARYSAKENPERS